MHVLIVGTCLCASLTGCASFDQRPTHVPRTRSAIEIMQGSPVGLAYLGQHTDVFETRGEVQHVLLARLAPASMGIAAAPFFQEVDAKARKAARMTNTQRATRN